MGLLEIKQNKTKQTEKNTLVIISYYFSDTKMVKESRETEMM